MRKAPRWSEFYRFPVVGGVSLLAIGLTAAWWAKVDVSPMFETAMIRRGELWRLLTSIFLHTSLLHLVFNIYWLWIFGTFIEESFGQLKTAALIVLLAVGSSAFEFAFESGGVGLSGVGYGMFAMLWVLSAFDERFREAIDLRTIQLFVGWFVFCIVMTVAKVFPVGNIAHASGAVLGALVGVAIARPRQRGLATAVTIAVLGFGLWGSTLGRPRINLSAQGGYDEGKWGYDALKEGRNQEAVRWLREAVVYKPKMAVYWFDLGIAYQRMGQTQEAHMAYQRAQLLDPAKPEYADAAGQSK